MSIWPQIPLFGSLIINVFPRESRLFEFAHGFRPSEIQRLVEYHKSTGKVQFALAGYPKAFSGLDYLDPILSLRPPVVASTSVGLGADDSTYRAAGVEFLALAEFGFLRHFREN